MDLNQILANVFPKRAVTNPLLNLDVLRSYREGEIAAKDFLTGHTTILMSGPPLLRMAVKHPEVLSEIGLIRSISLTQSRSSLPIEEFGSGEQMTVPSVLSNSIPLNRLESTKGNMGFALYHWLIKTAKVTNTLNAVFNTQPGINPSAVASSSTAGGLDTYKDYFSLKSEIFYVPFGLLLIKLNRVNDFVSAGYAEVCKLPVLSVSMAAGDFLGDDGQVTFTRIIPAKGLKISTKPKQSYKMPGPYQENAV